MDMDIIENIEKIENEVQQIANKLEFNEFKINGDILQKFSQKIMKNSLKKTSSTNSKIQELFEQMFQDLIQDLDSQYTKYVENINSKLKDGIKQLQDHLNQIDKDLISVKYEKEEFIHKQKMKFEINVQKIDQQKIDTLNKNLAFLLKEKLEVQILIDTLQQKLKKQNIDLTKVIQDIKQQKLFNEQLKDKYDGLKKEIQDNIQQKEQINKKNENLNNQLKILSNQTKNELEVLNKLKSNAFELQKELGMSNKTQAEVLDQIQRDKNNIIILQTKIYEYTNTQTKIKGEIQDLESILIQLQEYKQNVQTDLATKLKNLQSLKEDLNKEQQNISEQQKLSESLKNSNVQLIQQINQIEHQIEALKQRKVILDQKIKINEKDLSRLENENQQLASEYNNLKQELEQFQNISSNNISGLRQQLSELKQKVQQLTIDNAKTKRDNNDLKQLYQQQFKVDMQTVENINQQIIQMEQQQKQLEQDNKILAEHGRQLEQDYQKYTKLKDNVISQGQQLDQLLNQVLETFQEVGKQHPNIKDSHQQLMDEIAEIQKNIGKKSDILKYEKIISILEQLNNLHLNEVKKIETIIQGLEKYNIQDSRFDKRISTNEKYLKMLQSIIEKTQSKGTVRFITQKLSNETYSLLATKLTETLTAQFARNVSDLLLYNRYLQNFSNFKHLLETSNEKIFQQDKLTPIINEIQDAKTIINIKQLYNLQYIMVLMKHFLVPLNAFKLDQKQLTSKYKTFIIKQNEVIQRNIDELNSLGLSTDTSKAQIQRNNEIINNMQKLVEKEYQDRQRFEEQQIRERKNPDMIKLEKREYDDTIRNMKISLQQVFKRSIPPYMVFAPAIGANPEQFALKVKNESLVPIYNKVFNQLSCENLLKQFPIISFLFEPSLTNANQKLCTSLIQARNKTLKTIRTTKVDSTAQPYDWTGVGNTLLGIIPIVQPYMQFVMLNMFEQLTGQSQEDPIFDPVLVNNTYNEFLKDETTSEQPDLNFDNFEPFFLELNKKIFDFIKYSPEEILSPKSIMTLYDKYKTIASSQLIREIGLNETSNVVQEAQFINKQFDTLAGIQARLTDILEKKNIQGVGKSRYNFKKFRDINEFLFALN